MKISLGSDGINIGIAENTSDVKDISVETSQDTETKKHTKNEQNIKELWISSWISTCKTEFRSIFLQYSPVQG